jgi:hypothetical protein
MIVHGAGQKASSGSTDDKIKGVTHLRTPKGTPLDRSTTMTHHQQSPEEMWAQAKWAALNPEFQAEIEQALLDGPWMQVRSQALLEAVAAAQRAGKDPNQYGSPQALVEAYGLEWPTEPESPTDGQGVNGG